MIRSPTRILAMFLGASVMVLTAGSDMQAAEDWEAHLTGAWTLPDNKCEDIFVDQGGHWAFRQPVDMYGSSFIVEGREIRGPEATCRIIRGETREEKINLVIGCKNTVSFTQNAVQLRVKNPNEVERFYPGVEMSVAFKKCQR
jgi:hypothetical protein